MKENKIMKMISRRDFLKASAVVGAAGVLTACGGSSDFDCCFLYCSFYRCFFYRSCCFRLC